MTSIIKYVYDKLFRLARQLSTDSSYTFSGILGLAVLLIGWYQLRRTDGAPPQQRTSQQIEQQEQRANTSETHASAQASAHLSSKPAEQKLTSGKPSVPVTSSVSAKLAGIRKVTISVPGVLVEEVQTALSESATVLEGAPGLLKQVASCADTYLIAMVDDLGEACCHAALEAAGVIGSTPGSISPHHLLFCSTSEGKVSIVRQLEPDLHIDGEASTIQDLQRFMPKLLHIDATSMISQNSNVTKSPSLAAYLGLA